MENIEFQRNLTRLILAEIEEYGFVLCGSAAIREHGLIRRPTEDVDLFTVQAHAESFPVAYRKVLEICARHDLKATPIRVTDQYAHLIVSDAENDLAVDMGVDWRGFPPASLSIGAVLSEKDAVGSKVAALYSRAEPRDYLDVDSIRCSGRYSDEELIDLAKESDRGFNKEFFTYRLATCELLFFSSVAHYGISEADFQAIQKRYAEWYVDLAKQNSSPSN